MLHSRTVLFRAPLAHDQMSTRQACHVRDLRVADAALELDFHFLLGFRLWTSAVLRVETLLLILFFLRGIGGPVPELVARARAVSATAVEEAAVGVVALLYEATLHRESAGCEGESRGFAALGVQALSAEVTVTSRFSSLRVELCLLCSFSRVWLLPVSVDG